MTAVRVIVEVVLMPPEQDSPTLNLDLNPVVEHDDGRRVKFDVFDQLALMVAPIRGVDQGPPVPVRGLT